jgi:hypothetical protein
MTYFTDNMLESGYIDACTKPIRTFFKPFRRDETIGDVVVDFHKSNSISLLSSAISLISAIASVGHLSAATKSLIIDQDFDKYKDELCDSAVCISLALTGGVLSATWGATAALNLSSRIIATGVDRIINCP